MKIFINGVEQPNADVLIVFEVADNVTDTNKDVAFEIADV